MLNEVGLVVTATLVALRILYQLRPSLSFVGDNISILTAVLLIYVPIMHLRLRRFPPPPFEKTISSILSSLRIFLITALSVFSLFLIGNHFYQNFLGYSFRFPEQALGFNEILIQIFIVALPEEFFFRGYLQTFVAQRFPKKFNFLGLPFLAMSWGVPITSFFFALSHTFITFRWWHFAIFFPSLAFGWLREKTGGLIAPILFHATCNLLIFWIGRAYV